MELTVISGLHLCPDVLHFEPLTCLQENPLSRTGMLPPWAWLRVKWVLGRVLRGRRGPSGVYSSLLVHRGCEPVSGSRPRNRLWLLGCDWPHFLPVSSETDGGTFTAAQLSAHLPGQPCGRAQTQTGLLAVSERGYSTPSVFPPPVWPRCPVSWADPRERNCWAVG